MNTRMEELRRQLRDLAPDDMKDRVTNDLDLFELMVLFYAIRRRRWCDNKEMLKNDFAVASSVIG